MREKLLQEVRQLEHQIDRFTDTTHPDSIARRQALMQCLEWRLHKLNEFERMKQHHGAVSHG